MLITQKQIKELPLETIDGKDSQELSTIVHILGEFMVHLKSAK